MPSPRPPLRRLTEPAVLVATGLGLGLLPAMPGTWASLAALPVAWAIYGGWGPVGIGVAALILFAAGCWAAGRAARTAGVADPGYIVIDEIAGQMLVLIAAPRDWRFYGAAFVLFRVFDIWKPFPIGWLDRNVAGGFGIMLDDAMAALYALLLIALAAGALGVRP